MLRCIKRFPEISCWIRPLIAVKNSSATSGGRHSGFVRAKWIRDSSIFPSSAYKESRHFLIPINAIKNRQLTSSNWCSFLIGIDSWREQSLTVDDREDTYVCNWGCPCLWRSNWANEQTSPTPTTSTVNCRRKSTTSWALGRSPK